MATGFPQGFPQISAPFVDPNTGQIHQTWLQLLIALFQRTGGNSGNLPNAIVTVTVTASPFVYTASVSGHIWIEEGTYADVTITRGGVTVSSGKVTRGIFPMSPNDVLTVTYGSFTPTIYFI